MLGVTSNSGIRDNHRRGLVADFLKAKIRGGSRLSVVSAYFTIYAYDLLREHLDQMIARLETESRIFTISDGNVV